MATQGSPATTNDEAWADQVADLVVDAIDSVRDKTVRPIQKVARGLVYGIIVAVIALPTAILALTGLLRFVDYAVPGAVWIVYLAFGILFTVAGMIIWSKKF